MTILWISGAILAGCAVFISEPLRTPLLIGLMLFLPLVDRQWQPPVWPRSALHRAMQIIVLLAAVVLIAWRPHFLGIAVSTLLMAALPEEWYFRAYVMPHIGNGWRANLVTSLLFAALHGLTHDWLTAALVFWPSLVYGWLYQRLRDLPLLVLLHALSNLVYAIGFGVWLHARLALLR